MSTLPLAANPRPAGAAIRRDRTAGSRSRRQTIRCRPALRHEGRGNAEPLVQGSSSGGKLVERFRVEHGIDRVGNDSDLLVLHGEPCTSLVGRPRADADDDARLPRGRPGPPPEVRTDMARLRGGGPKRHAAMDTEGRRWGREARGAVAPAQGHNAPIAARARGAAYTDPHPRRRPPVEAP